MPAVGGAVYFGSDVTCYVAFYGCEQAFIGYFDSPDIFLVGSAFLHYVDNEPWGYIVFIPQVDTYPVETVFAFSYFEILFFLLS